MILPIHRTNTSIAFEAVDFGNVFIAQFKVKNIEVACNTVFGHRLWNHNMATLNLIANQNLSWCFVKLLCNSKNLWKHLLEFLDIYRKKWLKPLGLPTKLDRLL